MMTQTKKFEHKKIVQNYIMQLNPYEHAPSLGYKIADMSRYAVAKNCSISDLSAEESKLFAL